MKEVPHVGAALRLRRIYNRLVRVYGPQNWWPAKSAIEVVIGAYLTQNTSWRSVEISLDNFRNAGVMNIQGLRTIGTEDLKLLIRPSGFYSRKAAALKAFITLLDNEFSGSLETMSEQPTPLVRSKLLSLPGVGPETADAILLYALEHPVPVADEYLRRIVERHDLLVPPARGKRASYDTLAELSEQAFADQPLRNRIEHFNEFHALTVAVGKAHCGRTPDCAHCPLADDLHQSTSK